MENLIYVYIAHSNQHPVLFGSGLGHPQPTCVVMASIEKINKNIHRKVGKLSLQVVFAALTKSILTLST